MFVPPCDNKRVGMRLEETYAHSGQGLHTYVRLPACNVTSNFAYLSLAELSEREQEGLVAQTRGSTRGCDMRRLSLYHHDHCRWHQRLHLPLLVENVLDLARSSSLISCSAQVNEPFADNIPCHSTL
jgi:hypothetical protein